MEFYVIKGNEIVWGPHSYPKAEQDAQAICQPSLGEEVVTEFPPKGKVWENDGWREKTLSEKVQDGEISLEDRRNLLKTEILLYCNSKLEQGVQFQSFNFQAREEDLIRMSLALKKIELGGDWSGFWRDSSNQWREITSEQLSQLALIAGNHWESCFRKSRTLIDQLPAKNKNQFANYNIQAEWNATV